MTRPNSFLYGSFDPEATAAMGRAFEAIRRLKPKVSSELIANRIIDLAKGGQRDSDQLCMLVIKELKRGFSSRSDWRLTGGMPLPSSSNLTWAA